MSGSIVEARRFDDDEILGWDEVWDAVRAPLVVWTEGSEKAWGLYAWQALTRLGMTKYVLRDERVECVVRALALAALNRDFCSRAFGEGELGDWTDVIVLADLPGSELVDEFSLGRLSEREGVFPDEYGDEGPDLRRVIAELVGKQYRRVGRALLNHLGEADLFAGLWQINQPNVSYPLPDEVVFDIVNNATADKMVAWEWLTREFG